MNMFFSALRKSINVLIKNSTHVSFHDSKLTTLLCGSFGKCQVHLEVRFTKYKNSSFLFVYFFYYYYYIYIKNFEIACYVLSSCL